MNRILIVEDDDDLRVNLSEILLKAGYQIEQASSATGAEAMVETGMFDVVLIDYMMPKKTGMETLITIRRLCPSARVIMMTAFATVENAVEAIKRGASDYVVKPFKIENLLTSIRLALEEKKFETSMHTLNFDDALSSLTNSIRRNILRLLDIRGRMRMMEITRAVEVDDHTKVVFHLRQLREAGIIQQEKDKSYTLAPGGIKAIECLRMIDKYLHSKEIT